MPHVKRYEPYYSRWVMVKMLHANNKKDQGRTGFQHKTCLGLVPIPPDRVPPMVCPNCNADCVKEAALEERLKSDGAILLEAPQKLLDVRPEDFTPGTIT